MKNLTRKYIQPIHHKRGNHTENIKTYLKPNSYHIIKRFLDLFLILFSSPLWVPLMGLCALLIKLQSPLDSVFFIQQRTGKGGKRFTMYKFRTMVTEAEALKKDLAHLNELQYPDFKITNDPRITKTGRILRRTSLDELPQLFNVIKGDMSLVGPRPTSFSVSTYKLWHSERLDVMPGVTGLWQVTGRGSTEFDTRLRQDITYIEHRCLLLDFKILIWTISSVLAQRGAH